MRRTLILSLLSTTLFLLAACGGGAGQPQPQPNPDPSPQPTPVGTPVGIPVSKVIGMAGGSLASVDGKITLEIPAGALTKDETVSIQEITNNAPGKFGKAFRLSPEGTTFAKPARITFTFTEEQLKGAPLEAMQVGYQKDGLWKAAEVVARDAAAKTVTVETNHFSDWSPVPGAQLDPSMAHVKEGGTVNLKVIVCDTEKAGPLEGTFECVPSTIAAHAARGWSVNGVAGGNASVGRVSGNVPGEATYTAPATKPRPNTVAVSVQMNGINPDGGPSPLLILVASIVVGDDDAQWQGTITYTESGTRENRRTDGFTGVITDKFKQTHTFTVVGVKEVNGPSTTLLLRHTGSAETTRSGNWHREIYEICQAQGPVVLRYWDDYTVNYTLTGTIDETVEARLYQGADGGYNMYVSGESIHSKGQEVVSDIHKDGCSKTTTDNSFTKDRDYLDNMSEEIAVVGVGPDPKNQNHLSGGYEGKDSSGGVLSVPTTWAVTWDLSRGR